MQLFTITTESLLQRKDLKGGKLAESNGQIQCLVCYSTIAVPKEYNLCVRINSKTILVHTVNRSWHSWRIFWIRNRATSQIWIKQMKPQFKLVLPHLEWLRRPRDYLSKETIWKNVYWKLVKYYAKKRSRFSRRSVFQLVPLLAVSLQTHINNSPQSEGNCNIIIGTGQEYQHHQQRYLGCICSRSRQIF